MRTWRAMRGAAAALAAMWAWTAPAGGEQLYATPEIAAIVELEIGAGRAWGMRAELGDSGFYVGLALACRPEEPAHAEATAYFGGFPEDRRPVQLAVRGAEGTVERFGRAVSGGPESGFHSPQVTDPRDLARFVSAVLRPGALVSNGYRSFWNRVSEARNAEVRAQMLGCLQAVAAAGR